VQVIHVLDEASVDEAFAALPHADALLLDSGWPESDRGGDQHGDVVGRPLPVAAAKLVTRASTVAVAGLVRSARRRYIL
jgi:hypothetical protein